MKDFEQEFTDFLMKDKITQAAKLAPKIGLKGWPKDSKVFWDFEANTWSLNIPKHVRDFISKQLRLKGKNLSLGSGSFPYVKNSVLVDISPAMLEAVPACRFKSIVADLDKELPLEDNSFDSATMVFVVNYLKDLKFTFSEVKRVLKKKGKLVIVQTTKPVDKLYKIQEKKVWSPKHIISLLNNQGFSSKLENKKIQNTELVFIRAQLK